MKLRKNKAVSESNMGKYLMAVYRALHKTYGPQHWWPGDSPFEVMIGAVLTQNTAWGNVEKAIAELKRCGLLTPARLYSVPPTRLAALIRPSGYFNIKTKRLRALLSFIMNDYRGSLKRIFEEETAELRKKLLAINGIGPETADSILLYAAEKPVFVVDAYTKRIFSRHGFIRDHAEYHDVQRLFMGFLPEDKKIYNEYHALIVKLGKERCRKTAPRCSGCPIEGFKRTVRPERSPIYRQLFGKQHNIL